MHTPTPIQIEQKDKDLQLEMCETTTFILTGGKVYFSGRDIVYPKSKMNSFTLLSDITGIKTIIADKHSDLRLCMLAHSGKLFYIYPGSYGIRELSLDFSLLCPRFVKM
jgi:hypothetical protein